MNKKTIEITNYDLLNIISWMSDKDGWYQNTKLPISVRRIFKDIIKKIGGLKSDYDEDEKEITGEFTDDKHSDPVEGKDGVRQVKEKYLADFNKARLELLSIKRELEFVPLPCSAVSDMEILDKDYRILDLFLED